MLIPGVNRPSSLSSEGTQLLALRGARLGPSRTVGGVLRDLIPQLAPDRCSWSSSLELAQRILAFAGAQPLQLTGQYRLMKRTVIAEGEVDAAAMPTAG